MLKQLDITLCYVTECLRNVAEANGGMKTVAEKAHLNRESLYRCHAGAILKYEPSLTCCMELDCD